LKKVLLLVDQKARDLASVLLVGEYLSAMGIRASYCNKGNMLAACERAKPDVLVLSCSEGEYSDLARYVAPHCKIALMTQEGACATKESTILRHTMRGMGVDTYIKGLSRVYLWSDISKRWLLEEGVYPEAIIRVFGTSRIDAYRQADRRKFDPQSRIRVGIANRGAFINPTIKRNPIQNIDEFRAAEGSHRAYLDRNREWEDWIWHGMASLRVTLDLIEMLAASGQHEIVFRPDPYENYRSYDFLKTKYSCFQINVDPILCNFIDEIDVLVTEFSTTGTDALLLKKPVISTQKLIGPRLAEHNSLKNHLNPSHMQFYWQPESKGEFLKTLNDCATGVIPYSPEPERAETYLSDFYNWPADGPSAAYLIAKDLAALCHEEVTGEMAERHRLEYREHPFIQRLAHRTHFPAWLVKKVLLRPLVFDLRNAYGSFRRGDLEGHMRMEYYWWQREDSDRAQKIFEKLKKTDLDICSKAEK